jgi:hypothetical protein
MFWHGTGRDDDDVVNKMSRRDTCEPGFLLTRKLTTPFLVNLNANTGGVHKGQRFCSVVNGVSVQPLTG